MIRQKMFLARKRYRRPRLSPDFGSLSRPAIRFKFTSSLQDVFKAMPPANLRYCSLQGISQTHVIPQFPFPRSTAATKYRRVGNPSPTRAAPLKVSRRVGLCLTAARSAIMAPPPLEKQYMSSGSAPKKAAAVPRPSAR